MAEKTVLITGSTDGIGKQTALELAKMHHRVFIHARTRARGEPVLEMIKRESGNDRVNLLVADFASMKQVRQMVEQFLSFSDKLDVLINNAGVFMNERTVTEDGFEKTFAVNYLAHFLLTNLLLDIILCSAPARILYVSSMAHQNGRIDFGNLQGELFFDGGNAYAQSKLAEIMFSFELAERLEGADVTVNSLHPGVISTKLMHTGFGMGGGSLEEGAVTPVYLATSPDVKGVTGKYFANMRARPASSLSYDSDLRQKLWKVSEDLVLSYAQS